MGELQERRFILRLLEEEEVSRRYVLKSIGAALGAAAAGPLLFTSVDADELFKTRNNLGYDANTSVKGSVTFWHHYGSSLRHGAIRRIIADFNRHYKNVHVHDTAMPFGAPWDKTVAAVAAGKGIPDLVVSDRPKLWHEAKHKVYEPVTDLIKRDHIKSSSFFKSLWQQTLYKGGVYGLPWETDARVLYWNRAMFLDAKLNANKGPVTWGDLPKFAAKLDKKGGGPGGWSVITFSPTYSLALADWAWTNNGAWQNSKQVPTINAARNVQTATWMKSWVDRYGGMSTLTAISSRNTDPGHQEFGNKYAAMFEDTPGLQAVLEYYDIRFYTAKGDRIYPYWGVGLLPHNTGGRSRNFTGGFGLSIPRNSHRSKANREAAWEFAKYMSLNGQHLWAQLTEALPSAVSIAKSKSLSSTITHWNVFLAALALGDAGDVNYHDVQFPGDVLNHAQDDILNGRASAKAALDAAQSQALQNMKKPGGG